MTRFAVIVRGAAVAPGAPFPGAAAPHPAAETGPEPERTCTATTKAGEPCKGRPGDDGLCAAHKDT
jgi:uncharacterized protein DUF5763